MSSSSSNDTVEMKDESTTTTTTTDDNKDGAAAPAPSARELVLAGMLLPKSLLVRAIQLHLSHHH